jgi:hypothetical protein
MFYAIITINTWTYLTHLLDEETEVLKTRNLPKVLQTGPTQGPSHLNYT